MSSSGPNNPASAATSTPPTGSSWVSVSNILGSTVNAANTSSSTNGTKSEFLRATNFGFSMPSDATIEGIEVVIKRYSSNSEAGLPKTVTDTEVRIIKGGTKGTTDRSDTGQWNTTTDGFGTYGGSTDLWGETWTPADINAADFGAGIAVIIGSDGTSVAGHVKEFAVTVYYTCPSDGPNAPNAQTGWGGTNAKVSDNTFATESSAVDLTVSSTLSVNDFGFAIPGGATICGIEVTVERKASHNAGANLVNSWTHKIIRDGATGAENKGGAATWPTSEASELLGANDDLWSEAWNPTLINQSNFGFELKVRFSSDGTTITASVDAISITVYYTTDVSAGSLQAASIFLAMIGTP